MEKNPLYNISKKIFITGGDILLELNNRANADGTESWVPVTKKVYWPPPGPVKAESSPSVHSGKFFIFCDTFLYFILDMMVSLKVLYKKYTLLSLTFDSSCSKYMVILKLYTRIGYFKLGQNHVQVN